MYRIRKILILGLMLACICLTARGESLLSGGEAERYESIGLDEVGVCAPVALPWAIKICGGATRSGWGRMATSQAFVGAIALTAMLTTKYTTHRVRPDGSDDRSFFSGHTTMAFAGATMATRELAWRSPWYSMGSYAVASAVGMQRVMSRRHHPMDVMAGAFVGIASAQVGYLIGDAIFGKRDMDKRYLPSVPGDVANRSHLTLTTGIVVPIGRDLEMGDSRYLSPKIGLRTALDCAWAADEHWQLGGGVALTSMPMSLRGEPSVDSSLPRPLNEIEVMLAPGYSTAITSRLLMTARVGGGYAWRMHLHSLGGVQTSSGGPLGIAEIGASTPLTERLSCGLTVGYRIGSYEYTSPWRGAPLKGTDHRLQIGLSSIVNF